MSTRRKIDDVVRKTGSAGFTMELFVVNIPNVPENKGIEGCMLGCDDSECREWPTVWIENSQDALYHISECQMEDYHAQDH